jgi:transcriptional regulator with AAA-type ATPase domain
LEQLLGGSPALTACTRRARAPARTHTPASKRLPSILITGETGTGKGLVAHLIHEIGPRAGAAFVDLNCAAIPDTLLEAELFGFERGAFTDAKQAKAGLLQVAHRGTIFLDEIGLMPDALQAKLLKAIEDRSIRRLGGTRAEPADAWVIAATSEDLAGAIRLRRFREDLYHRLAVVTVQLPPLRERGADVLILARHYLDRACSEYGLPPKTISADAEAALLAYTWPGNVRELANVMERVALLSDASQVSADALRLPRGPRVAAALRSGESVNDQIASVERSRIEDALRAESWNISRAAARLGLPRNTLRYRMERHGLFESESPARRRSESPRDVPPSVRWQRTRITLLQAHVSDSEAFEADHERARVLDIIAAKVSALGGRVIEVGAESVKAAFGLDVAEDAARHAAHAAFAAQRAAAVAMPPTRMLVRIAIHTDEILVGRLEDRVELDSDSRRAAESTLEALLAGSPGESMIASAAAKTLLERRFTLERIDSIGSQSWRIAGLIDADRYTTPFVARAREIALLDDLLAQVEDGRGQAVLVAGDAGIGKTRLLHEFRRRTRGRAAWLQGAAVSFGSALPFHPLIDLLKNAFSIGPTDSDDVIAERIDRASTAFGDAFRPSVRFLRSLLSVDPAVEPSLAQLDPKLLRAGIFEAIGRYLHASSEAQPLIVVLEDLHWMDQATGEFLAMMAESLIGGRVLLCATHRTGYVLPFPQGAFATQITLSRVSRADTGMLGGSIPRGVCALGRPAAVCRRQDRRQSVLRRGSVVLAERARSARSARVTRLAWCGRLRRSMYPTASRTCCSGVSIVSIAHRAMCCVWRR